MPSWRLNLWIFVGYGHPYIHANTHTTTHNHDKAIEDFIFIFWTSDWPSWPLPSLNPFCLIHQFPTVAKQGPNFVSSKQLFSTSERYPTISCLQQNQGCQLTWPLPGSENQGGKESRRKWGLRGHVTILTCRAFSPRTYGTFQVLCWNSLLIKHQSHYSREGVNLIEY